MFDHMKDLAQMAVLGMSGPGLSIEEKELSRIRNERENRERAAIAALKAELAEWKAMKHRISAPLLGPRHEV